MGICVEKVQLGGCLKAERKRRKLSLEQMAEQLGIAVSTVSYMERGLPSVSEEKYTDYAKLVGLGKLVGSPSEVEAKIDFLRTKLEDVEDIVSANPDKALEHLGRLEQEEGISSILSLSPLIFYLKGRAFFGKWELDRAKEQFELALKHLDNLAQRDNTNVKACCLSELGRVAYYKQDLLQALFFTEEGLVSIVENGKRKEIQASLMLNKVIYLEVLKQYEKALNAVEKLNEYISKQDAFQEVKLYIVIQMYAMYASILNELNMREKAIDYAKKGICIARLNKEYDQLFVLWIQIGIINANLEKWEQSEAYYLKALEIEREVKNKQLCHLHIIAMAHY